jgi:Flp pilus assembly pilin Flp
MDQRIKSVRRASATLLNDERGLSTVEYVVILVLVCAVAIGTWTMFGQQVRCALGMANDTVAAGIGVDSTVGPQACAKSTPSEGTDPGEHEKRKKKEKHPAGP